MAQSVARTKDGATMRRKCVAQRRTDDVMPSLEELAAPATQIALASPTIPMSEQMRPGLPASSSIASPRPPSPALVSFDLLSEVDSVPVKIGRLFSK
jgi:hypothetical protein